MKLTKKIKSFLNECKITLRLTKRPTKEELKTIVQITSIGALLIGTIGFAIRAIFWYVFKV